MKMLNLENHHFYFLVCLFLFFAFYSLIQYSDFLTFPNFTNNQYPSDNSTIIPSIDYEDQYCISYNFLEATNSFRLDDGLEPITMATHGTSDMISTFEKMPEMWDGPISIGLFLDVKTQSSLEYLVDVHRCNEDFREKMTIHLAFRKSPYQDSCSSLRIPTSNVSCEEFKKKQKTTRNSIPGAFTLYPCSLMRNVARRGAKSDLHFVMDGDMVTSEGMALKIKPISNQILGNGNSTNVLLVRRFESASGSEIPRTVEKLEKAMKKKQTFEFHHRFFFVGHKINDLPKWLAQSKDDFNISSWEIPYANPAWEPQPILHRNSPYNADYFPSRILNVQSLIYKLCRANYTFHLLSHVFSVQEGVKFRNTEYSKAVSIHQEKYSKAQAFEKYNLEMDDLYPTTKKKCGEFGQTKFR